MTGVPNLSRAALVGWATLTSQSDANRLLVTIWCLALVIPYQLELRPRLDAVDLGCRDSAFTSVTDYIVNLALLARILALAACCKVRVQTVPWVKRVRLFAKLIVFCGFMLVFPCLLTLIAVHGACGFSELFCHLIIAGILLLQSTLCTCGAADIVPLPEQIQKPRASITLQEAEVKARQILGGLSGLTWGDGVAEHSHDHQLTTSDSCCSICLADFEPLETVKVTPCKHGIHQHCLEKWLTQQVMQRRAPSCVVCRQALERPAGGKWAARRMPEVIPR